MINSGMHFVHPAEIIPMEEEADDDESEIPFSVSYLTFLPCFDLVCSIFGRGLENFHATVFFSLIAALSVLPKKLEAQGPFSNFADLKTRPAHLAAFINYLLTNANPSSVFFYLITDAYQNSGAGSKDLRKWAYEIFSTFLIPNSPLCWGSIDQSLIQSIDRVLAGSLHAADSDIDQLRRIFVAARKKSLDDIGENLTDFRQKRLIGFFLILIL
ncbi:unnamed protein product [Gongylonema pulchrum]|uniref:RGS-like domain-containing protein n=1 Tax=Gongylonema pulchrum TaxID=637853 RepID=A0A183CV67_9BILA|nr:unnamed protein product [Gongylonema pulchrum]